MKIAFFDVRDGHIPLVGPAGDGPLWVVDFSVGHDKHENYGRAVVFASSKEEARLNFCASLDCAEIKFVNGVSLPIANPNIIVHSAWETGDLEFSGRIHAVDTPEGDVDITLTRVSPTRLAALVRALVSKD